MALCRGKLLLQLLSNPLKNHIPSMLVPCRTATIPREHVKPLLDVDVLNDNVDNFYRFNMIRPPNIDETTLFDFDPEIKKFTNFLMLNDKQLAIQIMNATITRIKRIQLKRYHKTESEDEKQRIELDARVIIKTAINNCKPALTLKRIAKGGVAYRIPEFCSKDRSFRLGCQFIINSVREDKKTKIPFVHRLATEILYAYENQGKGIQKKQALHKEAESNRAFAHYRWKTS